MNKRARTTYDSRCWVSAQYKSRCILCEASLLYLSSLMFAVNYSPEIPLSVFPAGTAALVRRIPWALNKRCREIRAAACHQWEHRGGLCANVRDVHKEKRRPPTIGIWGFRNQGGGGNSAESQLPRWSLSHCHTGCAVRWVLYRHQRLLVNDSSWRRIFLNSWSNF